MCCVYIVEKCLCCLGDYDQVVLCSVGLSVFMVCYVCMSSGRVLIDGLARLVRL